MATAEPPASPLVERCAHRVVLARTLLERLSHDRVHDIGYPGGFTRSLLSFGFPSNAA